MLLEGKRILITGGTGSLGQTLVRRILKGELGRPKKVIVFSRDEAKQHEMRMRYLNKRAATDDVIYRKVVETLQFQIGDVRDYSSISSALRDADVVFNAAALKQVPTCEYFPYQAVLTNIVGPQNIVRSITEQGLPVEVVVGISTDKACKPVNVMGMTKSIQERIFITANLQCQHTRFVCVRYGNVLASRGSVIPLFHEQIRNGGPLTITTPEMTRFLLSLDHAVDTVFAAVRDAKPGETYIPRVPATRVVDVAEALIGDRPIQTVATGIRPGEKVHEVLVSDEERHRTVDRGSYYAIMPILPELRTEADPRICLDEEYSSSRDLMNKEELRDLLREHGLLMDQNAAAEEELLR